jgi:hypothetical protein
VRVIIVKNYEESSIKAAIKLYEAGEIDFSQVVTFSFMNIMV